MTGKRCHAGGTPKRIVLDGLPSIALANPGNRAFPSALPAGGTGIPVLLRRKVPDPVSDRIPAASAPR